MNKNEHQNRFISHDDVWECDFASNDGACKIIGRCIFPFPYNPKICGYRTEQGQIDFVNISTIQKH